jgi:hypothetical protein
VPAAQAALLQTHSVDSDVGSQDDRPLTQHELNSKTKPDNSSKNSVLKILGDSRLYELNGLSIDSSKIETAIHNDVPWITSNANPPYRPDSQHGCEQLQSTSTFYIPQFN